MDTREMEFRWELIFPKREKPVLIVTVWKYRFNVYYTLTLNYLKAKLRFIAAFALKVKAPDDKKLNERFIHHGLDRRKS